MRAPMNCMLVGRWRIVEADIWDRQHLDLCGPATIIIRANGRGEIAFGTKHLLYRMTHSRASSAAYGRSKVTLALAVDDVCFHHQQERRSDFMEHPGSNPTSNFTIPPGIIRIIMYDADFAREL